MRPLAAQLVVIAKAPVPGKVKTRLTPAYTPHEAARLAEAALADTLDAAARTPFARRTLALAGAPAALRGGAGEASADAAWLPPGFEVTGQRGNGLDERIAAALDEVYAQLAVPIVLIGMDTPQVTPGLLESVARPLASGEADAVFGPARDGGFWLLGLRRPDPDLILGVPMSQTHTGRGQLARLVRAKLRVHLAPELIDVDTVSDAQEVAGQAPASRFAAAVLAMGDRRTAASRPVLGEPTGAADLAGPADLAGRASTVPLAGAAAGR
jgi:rSAM/selenodomain-associated transferase 1